MAAYLASIAETHSRATIRRRLLGIGQAHRYAGRDWISGHPIIRATLRGMFRVHGTPARKSAAIGTADIRRMVATCDHGLTGLRDRTLILLGFAGALRRAELATVQREHLTFVHEGVRLLIPRAKGDQEGEGREIGIPKGDRKETCPIRALETWLTASECKMAPCSASSIAGAMSSTGVTLQLKVILALFTRVAALNDDTQPASNIKYAAILKLWRAGLCRVGGM